VFFSVWRRQGDGLWRVVVDGGVSMQAAVPDAAFGEDPRPLAPVVAATSDAEQKRELTALEAQLQAGDALAAAGGYAALLADDALLIVGPTPLSLGRDAIIASLAERGLRFRCETLAAGVSRSDDLAYTYGRLHRLDAAGNAGGHYVHVWMRDRGGRWRISAELILLPS
jgi:ketosteroid isomerase-like protein